MFLGGISLSRIIYKVISVMILITLLGGCGSDKINKSEVKNGSKEGKIIQIVKAEINPEKSIGTDMTQLDFASEDKIIFHGYFGLFVYDLKEEKIIRSLDLKPINCNFTQGDNYCEVQVDEKGEAVQLHNISSSKMYIYSPSEDTLTETEYKPMSNGFMTTDTSEYFKDNNGLLSIKSVRFENGKYGYLIAEGSTVKTLEYRYGDKKYTLFK